MSDGKFEN